MRLEDDIKKPETTKKINEAMIRDFVPLDKKTHVKIELKDYKMNGNMGTHIAKFKKFVKVTDNEMNESYILLFNPPARYEKFYCKKFLVGDPREGDNITVLYEFSLMLSVAMQ